MKYGDDPLTSTESDGQLIFDFHKAGRAGPAAKQNGSRPEQLDLEEYLAPRDVRRNFRIPLSTQKVWSWQTAHNKPGNPGIPFIKIRSRVLNPKAKFLAWIAAQQILSTLQTTPRRPLAS